MFRSPLVIGLAASIALGCTHRAQPQPTRQGPDLAEQVVATLLTGIARGSLYEPEHLRVAGIRADLGAGATAAMDQQTPAPVVAAPGPPPAGVPPPGGGVSAPPPPASAGATGTSSSVQSEPARPGPSSEPAAQPEVEPSAPAEATEAPASEPPEQASLEQQTSAEAAQEPSAEQYESPRQNAVQPEFPSGSGVDTFGQQEESAQQVVVPGVGAALPLTLRQRSLATPAAAGAGTPEESRGIAGFTGAGAGEGFTGVSAGSAFTGVGAGEGFTGAGAGEGFTGVGAGQSFTSPGAGVNPYLAGPGWPTPVYGFGWIPGTTGR